MRILRLSLLLFILGFQGYGQYYSTGPDPASIRWKSIKTDRYHLVFPAFFEAKAQYFANVMDVVCLSETSSLSAKVPRIPVLFHTEAVISNGLTTWAPKRIELYPFPPQQTYPEEWLEQLAIHEYRHAVQISKMNQGFSKALYYVFGEQITGGILGLYVPQWFLEGDATVTETALTHTGRGRSAQFESALRAQLLEKGIYSYDKATLGSYKSYVPDAYSLGYYLVGQARIRYGTELWNAALDRSARYPFMVVPFNSGIRKISGKWKTGLYRETLEKLTAEWKRQEDSTRRMPVRHITTGNPRNFSSYNHPIVLNDTTILADKSSMDDVDRFMLVNTATGKEKILMTPGYHTGGTTSIGGNFLAWSELEPDPRWPNRIHSVIRLYDFQSGKGKKLTSKSRYVGPVLSHDGSRLVAVTVDDTGDCCLDILQVPTGRLIRRYKIPRGSQAVTPNWSDDATRVVFSLLDHRGETISTLDTATGAIRNLLPWSYNEFTGPAFFYDNYIIFSVDHSGIENIYAFDTLTSGIFSITSGKYASFDPDVTYDKKHLVFSDYTSDGLMVAELPLDQSKWVPWSNIQDHTYPLAAMLAKQEGMNIQDTLARKRIYKLNSLANPDLTRDTIEGTIYPVKRYPKALHLFNPHSWAPLSLDLGNLDVKPGVSVLSQNLLGTMLANAGYAYDLNERTGKFYAGLVYQGWYPEIGVQFDIGNRAGYARYAGQSTTYRFTWQETGLTVTASIPWNFSRGRWNTYLTPSVGTTTTWIRHNSTTPDAFTSGYIQIMNYSVSASRTRRTVERDMFPKFGQSLYAAYRNTPFGGNDMGYIVGAAANLYFPGIVRHQGIKVYAGYQLRSQEDVYGYSYSDIVSYPRGYSDARDDEMLTLRLNYKLPLWCPDFSFGSVAYLKRLKMNLFFDWAEGHNPGYIDSYQSTGAELTAELNILRFFAPVEMGIRSIWFPLSNSWGFEFLYSISY